MTRAEILAPAGSMEAFKAGLAAGANALYLGEKDFSARAHAQNFSLEEIKEAVDLAHSQGAKVHLALNTLLSDRELDRAGEKAVDLAKIGVDAFIVQDLGLVRVLRSILPSMDLHGSTQMTIHNVKGARLLKDLGFSRVVLSRETPLEEIKRIKEEVPIEVEVFVHGALCVCYSGQCTMSSYIGGRSGNRGDCAQPCRKTYDLVDGQGKNYLSGYLLSPRDLWTLDHVEDLLDLGVDSFKIEGRMKKPSYVAYVTQMFQKALEGKRDKDLETRAKEAFNRGFTKGRTFGAFGKDFMTEDHGKNKGILVGKVLDKQSIFLDQALKNGDGISYLDRQGDSRGFEVNEDLAKGRQILNFPYLPKEGSSIYRTSRAREDQTLPGSLDPIGLEGQLKIKAGQAISLEIFQPKRISVQGPVPDKAKKQGLSPDRVLDQMNKLGDTPFYLKSLDLDLDQDLFLPVKALNALRREAVEGLLKIYSPSRQKLDLGKLPEISREKIQAGKTSLSLENWEVFQGLKPEDLEKVDRIFTDDLKVIEGLKDFQGEVYYSLPPIVTGPQGEEEIKRARALAELGKIQGIEADNLWPLAYRKDLEGLKIHGGPGLNIFNSQAIAMARELGLDSIDISYEATYLQAQKMLEKAGGDLTTLYYGFLRSMIMDHCPNALVKGCGEDRKCETCPLAEVYYLEDKTGAQFPFRRKKDKTWIYNALPLYLGGKKKTYLDPGINLRVKGQFQDEPLREVLASLREPEDQVKGILKDRYGGWTYGHYKRGILGEDIYE